MEDPALSQNCCGEGISQPRKNVLSENEKAALGVLVEPLFSASKEEKAMPVRVVTIRRPKVEIRNGGGLAFPP